MAKVRLKRTWFGPGATRYRKSLPHGFTEVRDDHVPFLPRDAVVLTGSALKVNAAPKTMLMSEADDTRAALAATDEIVKRKSVDTEDEAAAKAAEAFARELAAEQAAAAEQKEEEEDQAADVASRDTKPAGRGRRK